MYPYIRTYLLYHYSEPFFVSERGYIPSFIENALEPMPKLHPSELKKKDKISYGEMIGFMVGSGTIKKKGCYISSESVKLFNEVVADLIHEEMYRFIVQLNGMGCQVDDSIRNFQQLYGFTEDDLPFENLKRWYYRERKRIEMRKILKQSVEPQMTLNFFEEVKAQQEQNNEQLGAQMSLLNFGG